MAETWKQHMQRMQRTYGHLPNHISSIIEREEAMSAVAPDGKYQIWGFEANANFDDANRDVDSENQTGEPAEVCVYATDDIDEARTIMRNGGFFRDDGKTWVVARRGVTVSVDG